MRRTRLVILPGARCLTQMCAILLFLSCPNIGALSREQLDLSRDDLYSENYLRLKGNNNDLPSEGKEMCSIIDSRINCGNTDIFHRQFNESTCPETLLETALFNIDQESKQLNSQDRSNVITGKILDLRFSGRTSRRSNVRSTDAIRGQRLVGSLENSNGRKSREIVSRRVQGTDQRDVYLIQNNANRIENRFSNRRENIISDGGNRRMKIERITRSSDFDQLRRNLDQRSVEKKYNIRSTTNTRERVLKLQRRENRAGNDRTNVNIRRETDSETQSNRNDRFDRRISNDNRRQNLREQNYRQRSVRFERERHNHQDRRGSLGENISGRISKLMNRKQPDLKRSQSLENSINLRQRVDNIQTSDERKITDSFVNRNGRNLQRARSEPNMNQRIEQRDSRKNTLEGDSNRSIRRLNKRAVNNEGDNGRIFRVTSSDRQNVPVISNRRREFHRSELEINIRRHNNRLLNSENNILQLSKSTRDHRDDDKERKLSRENIQRRYDSEESHLRKTTLSRKQNSIIYSYREEEATKRMSRNSMRSEKDMRRSSDRIKGRQTDVDRLNERRNSNLRTDRITGRQTYEGRLNERRNSNIRTDRITGRQTYEDRLNERRNSNILTERLNRISSRSKSLELNDRRLSNDDSRVRDSSRKPTTENYRQFRREFRGSRQDMEETTMNRRSNFIAYRKSPLTRLENVNSNILSETRRFFNPVNPVSNSRREINDQNSRREFVYDRVDNIRQTRDIQNTVSGKRETRIKNFRITNSRIRDRHLDNRMSRERSSVLKNSQLKNDIRLHTPVVSERMLRSSNTNLRRSDLNRSVGRNLRRNSENKMKSNEQRFDIDSRRSMDIRQNSVRLLNNNNDSRRSSTSRSREEIRSVYRKSVSLISRNRNENSLIQRSVERNDRRNSNLIVRENRRMNERIYNDRYDINNELTRENHFVREIYDLNFKTTFSTKSRETAIRVEAEISRYNNHQQFRKLNQNNIEFRQTSRINRQYLVVLPSNFISKATEYSRERENRNELKYQRTVRSSVIVRERSILFNDDKIRRTTSRSRNSERIVEQRTNRKSQENLSLFERQNKRFVQSTRRIEQLNGSLNIKEELIDQSPTFNEKLKNYVKQIYNTFMNVEEPSLLISIKNGFSSFLNTKEVTNAALVGTVACYMMTTNVK